MMQSIVSISPKSTPPPPSRRHNHHDMLATRRDINPATYYMREPSLSPRPRAYRSTRSRSLKAKNHASSSCMNLLSHAQNQNDTDHTQEAASSSLMDLFSYTASTAFARQSLSYLNFLEADEFHHREYNEFSNNNEFAVSPSASASDLYNGLKARNTNNKKRYKHKKMRSNIADYMRYMTMSDGEHSDEDQQEEGRGRYQYRYDFDHEANFEPQSAFPPQTTFDSVNDIFNLIPNADANTEEKEQENDGNDTKDTEDTMDSSNERTLVHKIRSILNDHDIEACTDSDSEAVFGSIQNMCVDLEENRSKMERYEHQYKDLENFLRKLRRENRTLKEKNNELENKLHLTNITKDNILQQMNDYLSQLMQETREYKGNNASVLFKDFRVKLSSMHDSLKDLAHDLDSDELQSAVDKLNKAVQDIEFLEHHGVYKRNHLENVIKDLLKDFDVKTAVYCTPQYPDTHEEKEREIERKDDDKLTKYGVFEEECPRVVRIDIDGGWFNKKTRAIIKYRGETFGRKEADFKWLYKMIEVVNASISVDTCSGDVIPDFCKELPHSLWPSNYLIKRKRELNLFLMQCHSLKNIKSGTPYHIFLEENKDNWKCKRNEFDKIMLKTIKTMN